MEWTKALFKAAGKGKATIDLATFAFATASAIDRAKAFAAIHS